MVVTHPPRFSFVVSSFQHRRRLPSERSGVHGGVYALNPSARTTRPVPFRVSTQTAPRWSPHTKSPIRQALSRTRKYCGACPSHVAATGGNVMLVISPEELR